MTFVVGSLSRNVRPRGGKEGWLGFVLLEASLLADTMNEGRGEHIS